MMLFLHREWQCIYCSCS